MDTTRILTVTRREADRVTQVLRNEFASGILVLIAAVLGFAAANSPFAESYFALRDFKIGPEVLHLNLSIGQWASDGLLAIFFFMVGLELKREFANGALSSFSSAIIPVAAAFGGVAVPAIVYLSFTWGTPEAHGWAIPSATDIAFAVTVLALIAPGIPTSLRVFLLTLAVVDDLVAITIIAIFYSDGVKWGWIAALLIPLALYAGLAHLGAAWFRRNPLAAWLILLPLGIVVWAMMHASGIHATIAGVLLAFVVPVKSSIRLTQQQEKRLTEPVLLRAKAPFDLAEIFGHRFGPLSSGIAVPVFAFFAAGVALGGESRFPFDPIAFGIIAGLVLGKPVGIVLTTLLISKITGSKFVSRVKMRDLIGVACLSGIGFTVALLVTDLSFNNPADADTGRLAVMAGSLLAVVLAAAFLVRFPKRR